MRLSSTGAARRFVALVLLAIGGLSCGRELTGPEASRVARGFSFLAQFGPDGGSAFEASDFEPFDRVRVLLLRANGSVALDRVVSFPAGESEVNVSFDVTLSSGTDASGEAMDLALAYINAAGDTVFRGGPIAVQVVPTRRGEEPPPPPVVPLRHTGVGSTAASVRISPRADTVLSGEGFAFTAVALDAQLNPIPDVKIGWYALDPALATVPNVLVGTGTTLAGRGAARIEARLANGKTDTVTVLVLPKAASIEVVSGSAQSGIAGAQLAQPLVVRARATDNLPIEGVTVQFAVTAGGGSVSAASAVTDSNGLAQVSWTLGATLGAQTVTASSTGLTGSPLAFTATPLAPPTTLILHLPIETNLNPTVGATPASPFGSALVAERQLRLPSIGGYAEFAAPVVPDSASYAVSLFVRDGEAAGLITYLSQGPADGEPLAIQRLANGKLRINGGWTTLVDAPTADGLFHHIVLSVNALTNVSRLYVDGTLRETLPAALRIDGDGSPTRLGRSVEGSTDYFVGDIDEFKVFDGPLTDAEVAALYAAGPSAPGKLEFVQQPSTVAAGAVLPAVQVRAADAMGRPLTSYTGAVTVALSNNPGGATLGGTLTVNAVGGIATFADLSLNISGSGYSLAATASGFMPGLSADFDITAGAATQLVFVSVPTSVEAGTTISPPIVVEARDAGGALATSFTGGVTLSLDAEPPGGALMGTLTVSAVGGVATFSAVEVTEVGAGYVLSAASAGLATAYSSSFSATAGGAVRLEFTVNPVTTVAGAILPTVEVTAFDVSSNVATGFTGSVTLNIGTNPAGGTLGGTLTRNAVAGVVVFENLTISAAGVGYTLVAASAGLTAGTSAPFTITSAAVTNAWTNVAGGLWSAGANWSQGRAPISTDTVLIAADGTYTVTLDVNFTGSLVTLGGGAGTQTLLANARTLSLSGGLTVRSTGVYELRAGQLSGAGPVLVEGQLLVSATASIVAPLSVAPTGTLEVRSSSVAGSTQLTVGNGFTNQGLVDLTAQNAAYTTTLTVTTGTLVNEAGATIRTAGTVGARLLAAQLDNRGTLQLDYPLTLSKASAQHVNSGTITLLSNNLTVTQSGTSPSFTNTGTITLATGRTLTVNGGVLDLTAGALSAETATLSLSGVTLSITPSTARARFNFGTGSTLVGPYTVPAGDSLQLFGGTLNGAGLTLEGRLLVLASSVVAAPITTTTNGSIRVLSSSLAGSTTLTVPSGFTNIGLIELDAINAAYTTALDVTSGSLINEAGATLRSAGSVGSRELGAQLENRGTLQLDYPLTILKGSAQHINTGTIALVSHNLTVQQSGTTPRFENEGTITLAAGRTLTVTGGALDLTSGTLTGYDATLSVANVALSITPATVRTRFDFNTGTTLAGPYTIPADDSLRVLGGTLATSGLTVNGRLVFLGSATVAAPVTTSAGGTIHVRSSSIAGSTTATVVDGFTNLGTIELEAVNAAYTTTLAVTNGTLINESGATIRSFGTVGSRVLAAQLDNRGTVQLDYPLTLSKASAQHVNSGSIALVTQNFTVTQSGTAPSFTNTGAMPLSAGRTFTVTGGSLDLTSGTLTGDDATLSLTNVALSITPATARTRFDFNTGTTLAGPYTIPAGDSLRVLGGTLTTSGLTVNGRLVFLGSATVAAPVTTAVGGTILVRSSSIAGSTTGTIVDGFTNLGTIELEAVNAAYTTTLAVTNGTLINEVGATIRSFGTVGSRVLAAQLDNRGTVQLDYPLTLSKASAQHVNSGSIALVTQNFTVSQTGTAPSFTNTGSIPLSAGRTFTVTGGSLDLTGGTLTGDDATLSVTNVALSITPATARTRFDFNTGTTLAGPYTIPAGDSLRVLGGTLTTSGLTVNGRLVFLGSATVAAPVTTAVGGTILVRSSSIAGSTTGTIVDGFTNLGTIELEAVNAAYTTTLAVTNGTLINEVGATIRSFGTVGSRVLAAQLDNRGTVQLDYPLTLSKASAQHVNSGSIALVTQNFTVTQSGTTPSFTNSGTIPMSAGRTLSVSGGTLVATAGLISGDDATLSLSNTVLTATPATVRTRFDFNTGSTLTGPYTIPAGDSLRVLGGTLNSSGLAVNGRLVFLGTATIAAPVTTASTGVIHLWSSGLAGGVTGTFVNGFTNLGQIELNVTGAAYTSTLAVTNGTLVNEAGATIRSIGSIGNRVLAAQLDNRGTLQLDYTLTLNKASAQHLNSGAVNVVGGDFGVTQSGTSPSFANSGAIDLASGRTFTVNGGALNLTGGTVTGGAATLSLSNVSLTATLPELRTRVNFNSGSSLTGALTIPAADSLVLVGGTLSGPGLDIAGKLSVLATSTIAAPITKQSGSLLEVLSSPFGGSINLTVTNGFDNRGDIDLNAISAAYTTTMTVTNGTLVNTDGSRIRAVGTVGSRILSAQLDNRGTLEVGIGLAMSRASSVHLNSGIIDVTGANLSITQSGTTPSFANSGTINIGSGRTFTISGGTVDLSAGDVVGPDGTLALPGTTLTLASAAANTRFNFGATAATLAAPYTIPVADSLVILGGTLNGAGLTVNGRLRVLGNATLGTPIATTGGSVVEISATSGGTNATFGNGFTNLGEILLTSTVSNTSTLTVTAGTLINETGGAIRSQVGGGGTRVLAAPLDNRGLLEVAFNLQMNRADAAHVNSGSITVASGAALSVVQTGTAPSFVNSGAISLAGTGTQLTVNGGAFSATAGSIQSTSTANLNLVNVASALNAANVSSPVNFGAGATLSSTLLIPLGDTLRAVGGTVAGAGVQVDGALLATGNLTVSAPITTSATGLIEVVNSVLSTPQDWTNNGEIRLSAPSASNNPQLAMAGFTLTNPGSITGAIGAGPNRYITVDSLNNTGTINIDAGLIFAGTLVQRAAYSVPLLRLQTVDILSLETGSTTTVLGTLSVTTCNKNGGVISGTGTIPALCLP